MSKFLIAAALGLAFTFSAHAQPAEQAASAPKAKSAQQSLMGTCNKEATGKKGDERKAFMKTCLADGKKQQQERMKRATPKLRARRATSARRSCPNA